MRVSQCLVVTTNVVMMPTRQYRVNHLEGLINLFSDLGPGQDNLAADEDEEHNLGLHHPINETWKQLGLVGAEVVMAARQTLQTDGELDVARADNVLDLKVRKLCVEPQLLDDSRVFARRQFRVVFRLGTRHDHLAGREDECGGLGFTDAHDDGGESLE